MHVYSTFTAALLAVAESSEERANALKAHDREPRFERRDNGAQFVTFSSPLFTLILDRAPAAGSWAYSWTWTDAAPVRPVLPLAPQEPPCTRA